MLPNTFGTSTNYYPLFDPREERSNRVRFRRESIPELCYANSYYSLSGRWPDVGWILLDRNSYNQIDRYSTSLQLCLGDFVNDPITFTNLTVVQARCVSTGISSDANAVYLVQVTNGEGVLYNTWFQTPVNAQYNVRVPAYDGKFYDWSLNGGAPWTWSTMIGDLWSQATAQLGTFPGLPSTPSGTPENIIFVGVSLWEAIITLLDHLGMTIAGSYPSLTIATIGATDSSFSALQSKYSKYLEDDLEYIDGGSGRVPKQVVVYFHRRNQVYGTEETVRYDSLQWQKTPVYTVTVNAPSAFSSAVGTGFLWSDLTVRYDQDGSPLAADVTMANIVAQERATQFYNGLFRGTSGFMRQTYSGILPFATGSLVDGVKWYNTGMDGYEKNDYCGWRTQIIRGSIWDEVELPMFLQGLKGPL